MFGLHPRTSTCVGLGAVVAGGLHVGPGVEYKMQSLVVNGNHATDKGGGILFSISSTSSSSSSFSVDKANLLSTSTKTQEFVSQWEDFSPLSSSVSYSLSSPPLSTSRMP